MAHGNDRYTRCEEKISELNMRVQTLEHENEHIKNVINMLALKIADINCEKYEEVI